VDARQRRELTRYGAPAAFLAAVTIAVLLIKAGLNEGSKPTTTGHALPTTTRPAPHPKPTPRRIPARVYYTVQSGDTLGAIALSQHTTVSELLRLNPGIDPRALHSGQRIRVH
jgi:LysM repeat protein